MKNIILTCITILTLGLTVRGQITLENDYAINDVNKKSGLTVIKLEVSGEKYLLYNIKEKKFTLYNLDHSVFKNISIPALPKYRTSTVDSSVSIAYISENLFNSDNMIEYISFDGPAFPTNTSLSSMRVFNETGSVIFSGDSLMPTPKRGATNYGYDDDSDFIFNTSSGTKMILYSYKNNMPSQRVYSLPGTLVTMINKGEDVSEKRVAFPNPTNNNISLPYTLKNGEEGSLVIYDIAGKKIMEYKIDSTFDNVLFNTNTLSSGSYFYSVYSKDAKLSTAKFVVTK